MEPTQHNPDALGQLEREYHELMDAGYSYPLDPATNEYPEEAQALLRRAHANLKLQHHLIDRMTAAHREA